MKTAVDDLLDKYRPGAPPPLPKAPSLYHQMFLEIHQDNQRLVAEIQRLRQRVSDMQAQRTLEGVREMESRSPRRRR